MNNVVKITLETREDGRPWIVATYEDGKRTVFGEVKTMRGAKVMLKKRAKQFGLTVNGWTAE